MSDEELIEKLSITWSNDSWDQVLSYKQLFKNKNNYYKYLVKNSDKYDLCSIWNELKLDWLLIQNEFKNLYNEGYYQRNLPRICPVCGKILSSRFISHLINCKYNHRDYVKLTTKDQGICNICGMEKPIIDDYYFPEYCSGHCAKIDSRSRWTYKDHFWKSKIEIDEHNSKFDHRDYSGLDYGRELVNNKRMNGDKRLIEISKRNLIRAHMANSYEHCEEFGITKDQLYDRLANRDMSVQINAMYESNVRNGFYESEAQSYHSSCIPHELRVKAGLASLASRFDGRLGKKSIYQGFEMASICELLGTILFQLENPSYKLIGVHKELPNYVNNLGSSYTDSIFQTSNNELINVEIHYKNDIDAIEKNKFCSELNGYKFILIDANNYELIQSILKFGYNAGRIFEYVSKLNAMQEMPYINLNDWKLT